MFCTLEGLCIMYSESFFCIVRGFVDGVKWEGLCELYSGGVYVYCIVGGLVCIVC